MINKQANILFIPTSIGGYSAEPRDSLSQFGYFQRSIYASLTRSIYASEEFQVLGRQLAAIARHAYFAKQVDAVEHAAQLILGLPVSYELRNVAQYYQTLCRWRRGEIDGPRQFEQLVEQAPPRLRARAFQAVGSAYYECGDVETALPFYLAAGRAAANRDLVTLAYSQSMTAIVCGIHGDHKQALADLESLFPLVRAVGKHYPILYYDFLNSLAVELAEVGRIAEAEGACAIALASPFAAVHPNWTETRKEIAAKQLVATPSVVAITRAAPSPKAAPKHNQKRLGKLSLVWTNCEKPFFQRTSRIAASVTIPHDVELTQTILNRVLVCIGSRAPPARY